MKTVITGTYPFDPTAKTVDFSSVIDFDQRRLYAVINQTTNQILFGPTLIGFGASFADSIMTLQCSTAGMSADNSLMVIYDDPLAETLVSDIDATALLTEILVKLPEFGTVGLASTEVTSVQGVAGMTPIKTDGDIADGADVAEGAKADAAATDSSSSWSVVALLKGIWAALGGVSAAPGGNTGASTTNGFLRWLRDYFFARLGALTSANSISVTDATDGLFATNFGAKADASASSDTGSFSHISLLKRVLTKLPGIGQQTMALSQSVAIASDQSTLAVKQQSTTSISKTYDGTVTYPYVQPLSVTQGMAQASIDIAGTWTGGTVTFGYIDATGSTQTLTMTRPSLSTYSATSATSTANSYSGGIPPGASSVIVIVSGFASGTLAVTITIGPGPYTPGATNSLLGAGINRASMSVAASKWTQQSVANLAAGATFTGTWQDMFNAATGVVGGSSSYPQEYRVFATCDKTCSLYRDVGPDGSTSFQLDTTVGAIPTDGTLYVCNPAPYRPASRYARSRFKNTSGSTSTSLYVSDAQVGS